MLLFCPNGKRTDFDCKIESVRGKTAYICDDFIHFERDVEETEGNGRVKDKM